jgi:N-methylhydantoinase A
MKTDDPALEEHFRALEAGNTAALRTADMRYVGQGYELNVPWSGDAVAHFHRLHEERYGYSDARRPVEVVNARVRIVSPAEELVLEPAEVREGDGSQAALKEKRIYCAGDWRVGKVYDRALLRAGDCFPGPAIIAEYSATTFLPPGVRAQVDEWLNLVIEL